MRKLTAVLFLLFILNSLYSQSSFRLQAGLVLDYLKSEGSSNVSYSNINPGATFGMGYELPVTKNFSVQPEFNYVYFKCAETVSGSKTNFNYLQLPILLKLISTKGNFSFYAGPQFSFLTHASTDRSGGTKEISDAVTETDFQGVAGIEFITTTNITINVRFAQGFMNVFKVEYNDPYRTRQQLGIFTLGYRFVKKQ